MSLRLAISSALLILAGACSDEPVPSPRLEPWQAVNAGFEGCQGSCGHHGQGETAAVLQPGAAPGQRTYCPVSGAVFTVAESTPHRLVDGKPYYFCCSGCMTYFEAHEPEVLLARGVRP